jgi:hypothetical protein
VALKAWVLLALADKPSGIENLRAIGVTPHVAQNKSPTKTGKRLTRTSHGSAGVLFGRLS